jgi:hypothetical protein
MNWIALLPIIIQYGLPVAEKLFQLWTSNAAPVQADWDALKALGLSTRKQDMTLALVRNGVDPTSPQGVALLALVV